MFRIKHGTGVAQSTENAAPVGIFAEHRCLGQAGRDNAAGKDPGIFLGRGILHDTFHQGCGAFTIAGQAFGLGFIDIVQRFLKGFVILVLFFNDRIGR